MIELKRTIYDKMNEWLKDPNKKVLEVRGARQVGKTFAINKFAKDNFEKRLYINCAETSGIRFRQIIDKIMRSDDIGDVVNRAIADFAKDFEDGEKNVIIIDEIQESALIYNLIREFRNSFSSRVIITGSYLGMIAKNVKVEEGRTFFMPVGDLYQLEMETLTFQEFLMANNVNDLYETTEPYGGSDPSNYEELSKWYRIYETIGGYPEVVSSYVTFGDIDKCHEILESIINVFSEESIRYFNNIEDIGSFKALLSGIATVMLHEKRGVDFIDEITDVILRKNTLKAGKEEVKRAISWLEASHVVGYTDKYDFDTKEIISNQRVYFKDMGIAYRFLTHSNASWSDIYGLLAENFAFLSINRRKREFTGERPHFGFYQKTQGELDFYVMSLKSRKNYGIEVKSGKNSGKTARLLLEKKKIDAIYYFKYDTQGGRTEIIFTIPLYLIDKTDFE